MSDNKFPDISVGDFAVDILKSMAKDPNSLKPALKESTLQSSNAPDVSKIRVDDDFVSLVVEGKKPKPKKVIRESVENRVENLVDRLSDLISEAKQLLVEMCGTTSTGNIGVSTGSTGKKKKIKKALGKYRGSYEYFRR
jgi:hypothetical protein